MKAPAPSTLYSLGMAAAVLCLPLAALVHPPAFLWVLWLWPPWLVAVLALSRCRSCGLPVWLRDKGGSGVFRYVYVSWPPKACSRCGAAV